MEEVKNKNLEPETKLDTCDTVKNLGKEVVELRSKITAIETTTNIIAKLADKVETMSKELETLKEVIQEIRNALEKFSSVGDKDKLKEVLSEALTEYIEGEDEEIESFLYYYEYNTQYPVVYILVEK